MPLCSLLLTFGRFSSAGPPFGIGGRSPALPSHTTGHAGPHPAADRLVPPVSRWAGRSRLGNPVRVSLLGLASFAASPRRADSRPAAAGWRVQYPHRDPSTTGPSYRSGLRRSRDYYA